jgi:hypothetical protein
MRIAAAEGLVRLAAAIHPEDPRRGPVDPLPAARIRDRVHSAKTWRDDTMPRNDDDSVSDWMRRESRAVRALVASGLELLDLAPVRERYSDRWPTVSDAIQRIITQTIDREIGPEDLFVPLGDDRWMIVYADAPSRAEGEARARRLAAKVSSLLDGADELTGVPMTEVPVHHVTLPLDRPAREIHTLRDLLQSWSRALSTAVAAEKSWDPETATRSVLVPVFRLSGGAGISPRAVSGFDLTAIRQGPAAPEDRTGHVRASLNAVNARRAARLDFGDRRRWILLRIAWRTLSVRTWRQAVVRAIASAPAGRRILLAIEGLDDAIPMSRLTSATQPLMGVGCIVFAVCKVSFLEDRHRMSAWLQHMATLGGRFGGVLVDFADDKVTMGVDGQRACLAALAHTARQARLLAEARIRSGLGGGRIRVRLLVTNIRSEGTVRALWRAASGRMGGPPGATPLPDLRPVSHLTTSHVVLPSTGSGGSAARPMLP